MRYGFIRYQWKWSLYQVWTLKDSNKFLIPPCVCIKSWHIHHVTSWGNWFYCHDQEGSNVSLSIIRNSLVLVFKNILEFSPRLKIDQSTLLTRDPMFFSFEANIAFCSLSWTSCVFGADHEFCSARSSQVSVVPESALSTNTCRPWLGIYAGSKNMKL